ncbi:PhzF family phenazine biosynthesis protein [Streptomyces sp. BI20]|uniref:PhzF family phenazine biosynthesis protein n=1 Tax=Streptomyces sp. BI20 TaxID=3403460 RepID=UPI003C743324
MRLRIVDTFAERPFHGNPAGVLLLESGFPADDWLRAVAAEVNHAETAFAHPLPPGSGADWALRWFTPTTEVDLCGHATLATAHVLARAGRLAPDGTARFRTRAGILTAAVAADGLVTLSLPACATTAVPVPDGLREALGGAPVLSVHATDPHVGDLIVELPDEAAVRAVVPDLTALRAWHPGVMVTAPAEDPARGWDFASRSFAPAVGIDEDPVTGGAHTALAAFWSPRLGGRRELVGRQGGARTGLVRVRLDGPRTLVAGHAVTVLDAELRAAPPA